MATKYNKITTQDIEYFRSVAGDNNVITGGENFEKYSHDETENLRFIPEVVVLPADANQISAVLKYCNGKLIPVTPRAAGTGLSGGALPVMGGVILSIEKLNRILSIDEANGQCITEPGVITEVLQNTLKEKGWFYPPDPASRGSCFIGGNVAENSGGPRAVKYGVVKDYVLNLEMVLPDGNIIWTGANVLKNSTGYNLTQLVVGSEGTLGIVTKIVLKIIPHPTNDILMLAPFKSAAKACEAVAAIFRAGITPSAMEFMERDAIDWTMKFISGIQFSIEDDVQAHLLIEMDGNDMDTLMKDAEKISGVLEQFECGEILFADSADQKARLWKLRRSVAEAVKSNSVYKEEDTVVPRAHLPQLLRYVKEIGNKYGFKSVCYGHAGDGNLHVNIIKGTMSETEWNEKITPGITEFFEKVVFLGGTISGEHGIGWVQKPYISIALDSTLLTLMSQIKKVFDPHEILNPGKIFPN